MQGVPRWGALAALVFLTTACGASRPEGWSDETHGKSAQAAYDVVFPSDKVQRFDIVISPENWQAMQDDMTDMLGAFGSGGGPGGTPPGGGPGGGMTPPPELTAACQDKTAGAECSATLNGTTFTSTCAKGPDGATLLCVPQGGPGGGMPGGGGIPGGGNADLIPRTPVYVESTVHFEGKTWWNVGIRLKGNSTLSQTWRSGVGKLPFRLNFDKFEDEHPGIEGQHFYGFSKLSFSNNQGDASLIRDKVASDTFLAAGIPAPHTAFAAVYVDHGDGPEYFGLYTLAEDPQKSLLRTHFGNDTGALYEADGTGAKWVTFDQESFGAESDAAEQGWESVEAAITALNSSRSDAEAWRTRLEARLDVEGFLQWLAVNTVMVNWDSYGRMSHNYYLYADPSDGDRLHWITWDHNLSMTSTQALSLTLSEVTADWPLIRFLMDDPVYRAKYEQYARETIEGPLAAATMQARMRQAHDLIAPWVVGENAEREGFTFTSAQQFEDALTGASGLLKHAEQREAAVRATFP
ncbi:CotH kinase family protein [Myxococcus sp. RHSTA-1-4]|uniref:CotH kinase family protein n=1 Tax=Myxococcus sp. RHSTA-1-4 TaxID=2874601 RepID=UPI001CC11C13|nr:CotH kinase family protein [Myxococcus sp. RHSTA-1-4]MBZ4420143.1 CotH kinase family protein [Myxococcus sp. RHSTA-1-4]